MTTRVREFCEAARLAFQFAKLTGQGHAVTAIEGGFLVQPATDALRAGQGAIWGSAMNRMPDGCAAGVSPMQSPARLPQAQAPTAPAATATTDAMRTATQTTLVPTTPAPPLVMQQAFFRADNPILWVGGLALLGVVGYFVFRSGE
jgi:hypothetical protein